MSFAHLKSRRKRLREAANFQIEGLERRVLLSSAIAAFGTQQTFEAGQAPVSLAVADVNKDGKPDFVVANTNNNVSIRVGDGNGGFSEGTLGFPLATGISPSSVAVADLNGDGAPDIAVANLVSGSVGVFLNAPGDFLVQETFATGPDPRAVLVADLNGDGKPDLIVPSASSNSVDVLLGNGNGTFQPFQSFAAGSYPDAVAVADVNGDGELDLIVADYDSANVSLLLGNGNGTFQQPVTFATGNGPVALASTDLNGDGKPDLVVADSADNCVGVLLGNGDGTFQAQQTFATGAAPVSVGVGDMNVDGKPDVVVANSGSNSVSVLLGNGNGTFQADQTFAVGINPSSVAVADVNRDGRPDILVANKGSNNVGVLLGDVPPTVLSINRTIPQGPITSDGSVTYTVAFNEPVTGVGPSDFALALSGVAATAPLVVNGSGAVYTVTVNGVSGTGTLGLNLVDNGSIEDAAGNPLQPGGVASFGPPQQIGTGYSTGVAVADVNGDGIPDIITVGGTAVVNVFLGNGNGTFQTARTFSAGGLARAVVTLDANGDGKPDIVTTDSTTYGVSVLLGNGDGTFQSPHTFGAGGPPKTLNVADMNGDGKPDLVVGSYSGIAFLLSNGDGTFTSLGIQPNRFELLAVATGDVDGDSKPDVLFTYWSGTNYTMEEFLSSTHTEHRVGSVGLAPDALAIGDVNRDGNSDLVVANEIINGSTNTSAASILLNEDEANSGAFLPPRTFQVHDGATAVALSDLTGDDRLDVITQSREDGIVSVLLGNGNGTFQNQETFLTNSRSYGGNIVAADLNGDGRPDLILSGSTTTVLLAQSNGNFTGQTYTIVPMLDTITGTGGVDQITLRLDADRVHIDWTLGGATAQSPINDPNGLTINGNGGNETITLDYTNGNPLPGILHLNGTFTINGLQGTNPLAGTTLDVGRSTLFITYSTADPIAAIQGYLQNGYNAGAWNGTPTATTGVITSAAAQANPNHSTAIGYADSADGQGINTMANTIELTYTLYGDANLDHQVNSADLQILLFNLNRPGAWDQGDFNYDGQVNSADLQNLLFTLNTGLGSQATPLPVAATPAATTTTSATGSSTDPPSRLPMINATGSTTTPRHHPHPAKVTARKRR
ncbi:MAG TPA: FG-GAP-like repeat-containing protein [Tepidisphaeraceae bacterium]|jgi:hypothetical protein|nr:FG-GAP-like repeat-containing protein [Tepidisphaeraceae bacterium]